MPLDYSEIVKVALASARDAAAVHQRHVGQVRPDQWTSKGAADFVTHVDREAEAKIVEHIRAAFPSHQIMAEEAVSDAGSTVPSWRAAEWLWIVDPLDGTTNFLHGYPMYAASVAAAHRGRIVAGAVVCGPTREEWTAQAGGGAYRNGEAVHVSAISELRPALIGTGFPFKNIGLMPVYLRQFDRVMRNTSGVRRAGAAAIDLCHVATGYFDGFWELDLNPWDFAAGSLFVREAGGVITAMNGELDPIASGSVLAGNPAIHAALGELLAPVS